MTEATPQQQALKQVLLQKIYVKDASIEVPQAPAIYAKPWKPNVDVQVSTAISGAGNNAGIENYQVILTVTVTAKLEQEVAFLAEVQQAGLFALKGLGDPNEKGAVLGGYCPGVLFPFAREFIASSIGHAGFPPVLLQPINFEALYQQSLQQARAQQTQAGDGVPPGIRTN
jgi:preprotein translocase subunit SecB